MEDSRLVAAIEAALDEAIASGDGATVSQLAEILRRLKKPQQPPGRRDVAVCARAA